MSKFIVILKLELGKDIPNKRIFFEFPRNNKKVRVTISTNKIILDVKDFDEARAYLDTLRAIINFVRIRSQPTPLSKINLDSLLYMPPYKCVFSKKESKSEGTIFFHNYQTIIINNELKKEIKELMDIANRYEGQSPDKNYYYWLLKFFTFSLDEISINPVNKKIIARSETLFLKFWTLFEIISQSNEKYKGINKNQKKGKFLTQAQINLFIGNLTNRNLGELDKIRNKIVHDGMIHQSIIKTNMLELIEICIESIQKIFELSKKKQINTISKLLNLRDEILDKCCIQNVK